MVKSYLNSSPLLFCDNPILDPSKYYRKQNKRTAVPKKYSIMQEGFVVRMLWIPKTKQEQANCQVKHQYLQADGKLNTKEGIKSIHCCTYSAPYSTHSGEKKCLGCLLHINSRRVGGKHYYISGCKAFLQFQQKQDSYKQKHTRKIKADFITTKMNRR